MTINVEALRQPLAVGKERVDLPEFGDGVYVYVRGMTAREKNEMDAELLNAAWDGVDKIKARTQQERLIAASVCDEDGTLVFSQSAEDIATIGAWPAAVASRLAGVATRLNGQPVADKKN